MVVMFRAIASCAKKPSKCLKIGSNPLFLRIMLVKLWKLSYICNMVYAMHKVFSISSTPNSKQKLKKTYEL